MTTLTDAVDSDGPPAVMATALFARVLQPVNRITSTDLEGTAIARAATMAQTTTPSSPLISTDENESPQSPSSASPALLSAMIVVSTLMCILIVVIAWFARRFYRARQKYVAQMHEYRHRHELATALHKASLERERSVLESESQFSNASFMAAANMVPRSEWGACALAPLPRALRGTAGHVDDLMAQAARHSPVDFTTTISSAPRSSSKDSHTATKSTSTTVKQPLQQCNSSEHSNDEASVQYAQTVEIVDMRQPKTAPLVDLPNPEFSKTGREMERSGTAGLGRAGRAM